MARSPARFAHRPTLFAILIAAATVGLGAVPAVAQTGEAVAPAAVSGPATAQGVLRLRSNHSVAQTVERLKVAITAKGVHFFDAIDQAQLGADAKLTIPPSTLVLFGNPPLGVQFLQSNPYAGLDWLVRMLVVEDKDGNVWLAWTDFAAIANRYGITDKPAQFAMAAGVAAAIAGEAAR